MTLAASPETARRDIAQRDPAASPQRPRLALTRTVFLVGAVVLIAVVFLLSLWVGARGISFAEVWQALWHPDGGETSFIVHEMRLPRAALALLVGAALGVAGALIQALTRNPLADTGILGVGAGANVAVVIAIGLLGVTALSQYMWFAFGGAVIVTVLVYALGSIGSAGATPVRLTLVGIALGAVLGGFASAITMLNPNSFDDMLRWSAGSLAGRGWGTLATVAIPIVIGLLIGAIAGRPLNAISLGDDLARSLGANVMRTRVLVIIAVTLLAGAATAAAGPIGFVGLMVPHVVRWFTGPDQRWIIPFSAVGAALLLLSSDVVGRVILAPQELEVGIVTAFIGAPVLILLARRTKVSTL
ncbi:iron chelate uptake ABC transporter family permease subunit [Microbacterium sp. ISL-59]|uniref:FecCD family ABC transporter permease n=1 Tax=Microbacterium sp. ISL-59 TaxID=2819159 RepID=UPI001BEC1843|nr:iron chelate uptake ABC transporter family permease subunit [Microbacterium sp. ISL-59]MBT2496880.1 iron chelate uptake ABC transporter family permease subunit [Microbacterium sp. ISL-59]